MPRLCAWRKRRQRVGGFTRLGDGDDQRLRIGHRGAITVFAGHFNLGWNAGDALQPVFGRATTVVAGTAGQDQHRVNLLEDPRRAGIRTVEQFGHDALHTFERVGNGARLLEDFLLHVMAVRAELGRATVCQHGLDRAIGGLNRLVGFVDEPVFAQLHIHHVALFQVDDLVGHAGQGHRVAGQEMFLTVLAHTQDQRRTGPCANQALRFVLAEHRNRIGAAQLLHRRLDRLKQITVVHAVDQVGDDFRVGLALEHITLGAQRFAQFIVVLDDAVVHQGDTPGAVVGIGAGAVAEMRMRVVHRRRAMGGPAGVGDASCTLELGLCHLFDQFGHA